MMGLISRMMVKKFILSATRLPGYGWHREGEITLGFLDEHYLLQSDLARDLYQQVKELPVVDLHNHSDIREIIENQGWDNIWDVEAATDHYVWELMRRRGVPEEKITGEASPQEKWRALAEVFPTFVGNPTYEWIHLDLHRRFGITEVISKETAGLIWQKAADSLLQESFSPRSLLKEMGVEIMCTTDDPLSGLEYHQRARRELGGITILPTWRPDQAVKIEQSNWRGYVRRLGEVTGIDVKNLKGFLESLQKTHDHFGRMGCKSSDHGLEEPLAYYVKEIRAGVIYEKALSGQPLTRMEINDFKSFLLNQFGRMNQEKGWITQLHIGVVRDYRRALFDRLGRDAGGDIIKNNVEVIENLRYFLNQFDGKLKVVLYYLDPGLLPTLASIARAFPGVNLGAPWWFNDSPSGMAEHLQYISSVDLLYNHAGMVTDSRKIMSFGSRTEMFRRVLCDVLGLMVQRGQMPYQAAGQLAKSLSYYRPLGLFRDNL